MEIVLTEQTSNDYWGAFFKPVFVSWNWSNREISLISSGINGDRYGYVVTNCFVSHSCKAWLPT